MDRTARIALILLESSDYVTATSVARALGVSVKTVRNSLSHVDSLLARHGLTLVRKTGVGLLVEGDEGRRLAARFSIPREAPESHPSPSPRQRANMIGLLLCMRDKVRTRELAELLYTSRASIGNDLAASEREFALFHVKLERHGTGGVSLRGSEKNIRNLLLALLQKSPEYAGFRSIIEDDSTQLTGADVFPELGVRDYDVAELARVTLDADSSGVFEGASSDALCQTLLRILLSLARVSAGHVIELSDGFVDSLSHLAFFPEASRILEAVYAGRGATLPQIEKFYLQVFLLALHGTNIPAGELSEAGAAVALMLATSWERELGLPLAQDKRLMEALCSYLSAAVMRFRHGIAIDDPYAELAAQLYPQTLAVVRRSLAALEEQAGLEVSDAEATYIALHLAAALERQKRPLRALLVTREGSAVTELMTEKAKRLLPELVICGHSFPFELEERDTSGVDLLLATMELDESPLPVVRVSPLMSDGDYNEVRAAVQRLYRLRNDPLRLGRNNESAIGSPASF